MDGHLVHVLFQPGDACFHMRIVGLRASIFDVQVKYFSQWPSAE
jgi:hypothetical protein